MITSLTSESLILAKHSSQRNFGLDLARTLAISLVLASHFSHNLLDSLGFWGVELFFALSGFLIGQILWRNFSQTSRWTGAQIMNFWRRRWWRTLPNYYLFFFISLISAFVNNEAVPSLLNVSKFLWFGQFISGHNWGFYSISWSLCIEEWFYLLFPLILLFFSLFTNHHKLSFILALLFIFIGSIAIRQILIYQDSTNYLRGITLARLDAIGYGVLIAYLVSIYKVNIVSKYIAFLLGVLLQVYTVFSVATLGLSHIVTSQVLLILVPLGFALMIPIISLIPNPSNSFPFISIVIEKVSLWSYSIYLAHGPIMWLTYSFFNKYRDTFYGNLFSKIIAVVLTLILSAFLYKYFEVPFTKKRPKELRV